MYKLEENLKYIAERLNGEGIKWLVGGSVLLSHFGLCDNPNDIDIIVPLDDAEKAESVLFKSGELRDMPMSKVFVSDFYRKIIIRGTEVDLIAGFKIKTDEGVFEYKPEFKKVLSGINYASLSDWAEIYKLMSKCKDKSELIEEFLAKNN